MSTRVETLRAQLELAIVEEELTEAKAAVNSPEVQKLREKVRKARAELREALAAGPDISAVKEKVRAARAAARADRPDAPVQEETE